jgi:hypothetical protein
MGELVSGNVAVFMNEIPKTRRNTTKNQTWFFGCTRRLAENLRHDRETQGAEVNNL